ncbi:MAG: glycosyltransferase family 4 protein [Anaerolineae bacterium]|jgi:glycosyltransferase involved in cell wall biosynthesis
MRLAIVTPRYGPDVLGGAETLARGLAHAATRRGWDVDVWTTCARSHYNWRNVHPAGVERHQGVLVHRFPVSRKAPHRHAELDLCLAERGELSPEDQYAWLESGAHSPQLYAHVARYASQRDLVLALPYAAPLIHYAAWAMPRQVVLWPCLHDEPYAFMEPVRLLLESVRGVMFLTPEEHDLALRRLGVRPRRTGIVGGGVTPWPDSADGGTPAGDLLLYVGRLEGGKNVGLLYESMRRYAERDSGVRLMVLGRGPSTPPRHPAIEYRGFVAEEEKRRIYRRALALCQPSLNESFSITVMESWLAGRPVLVHGACPVTRGHVERSRGGLWFSSCDEFVGAVEWLRSHPALATRMGQNGQRYVMANYTWSAVLARFEQLLVDWGMGDA